MDTETTKAGSGAPDATQIREQFEQLFYSSLGETWAGVRWLGVHAYKLPLDLWVMQEIVSDTRPDLIIETGVAEGGTTLFYATIFDLLGGEGRVIGVDVDLSKVDARVREHPRISLIEGGSTDPGVLARLEEAARGRRVMINLDSDHSALHVMSELRSLSSLVSPDCYLIVEDTVVNGNPVEPDFGPGPAEALEQWLTTKPPFEVDLAREHLLATFNKGGYLRRVDGEPGEQAPAQAASATPIVPPFPGRFEAEAPEAGDLAETRRARAALVDDGSRVLELGCGAGELAALLREKGCSVVGVEIDPELAAQAEETCEHVHRATLDDPGLNAELGSELFDAIVGIHALERSGPRLLELAGNHLEPGGRLVLAVANASHASSRLGLLEGRLPQPAGRAYTLDSLERELADSGFALARVARERTAAPALDASSDPLAHSVAARLAGDLEATTLRLLTVSYALPRADLELHRARIAGLARHADRLEAEVGRLRAVEESEREAREELIASRRAATEQGPELAALREALERSSVRVRELRDSVAMLSAKAEAEHAEAAGLGLKVRQLEAELVGTQRQLEGSHRDAVGARVRLQRIESMPPFRFYHRLRGIPPLSWIAARRARGYNRELKRAWDQNS